MAYNSFIPTQTTSGSPAISTNLEAVAGAVTDKMVVPSNLSSVFASPPPVGSTTPNSARFTSIGVNSSILNRVDISGGVAIGSYAGVNSAPSNGMIVSGFSSFGSSSNSELMRVQLASDSNVGLRTTQGTTAGNNVIQPLTGGLSGFAAINFNGYYSSVEQRYNTSKRRWRLFSDQISGDVLKFDTYNGAVTSDLITMTPSGLVGIGGTPINHLFEIYNGDCAVMSGGRRYRIAEGANACMGTAILVAGTITVSTTAVNANSRIFLTYLNSSGTRGSLAITNVNPSVSFVITSTSATDTSRVGWIIFDPA